MRDRASEREKLYIQAHYYDEVLLDPDKTLAVYAEWRQTYPRDSLPYDNGALVNSQIGHHDKALELASAAMQLDPKDGYAYANLCGAYEGLNRFDEAKSIGEQGLAQKLGGIGVRIVLADIAYIRGDWPAYDHIIDLSRGTPDEAFTLFFKASGQDALGKVQAGRLIWQQSRGEMLSAGIKDFAAALFDVEASDDNLLGYPADAERKAGQALELSNASEVRAFAAVIFAMTGETSKSDALVAGLHRDFPENRYLQLVMFPMTEAWKDLQKNQPSDTIAALEPVRPYELGVGAHGTGFAPNYLRGLAYLKLHDGAKAAVEFQRILDHQGVSATDPAYTLARLNLARAYVLQGDNAKARTAYQDFLAKWKDADPDVPVLKEAQAEYAKLN